MSSLDGRRNELELEKGYTEDAVDDLHDTVETAQNRKAEAEEAIADHEVTIDEKEETLEAKRESIAELEAELTELKADREDLREAAIEATRERDEQRARLGGGVRLGKTHRPPRPAGVGDRRAGVAGRRVRRRRDSGPRRGRVAYRGVRRGDGGVRARQHARAIDEYDEVEEALETLQERRDVLVEERDAIAERIEGYEAEKKRTFMETFESINDQFEDIFAPLGRRRRELLLENPEDPFEEGLTMKAQPADKPVQRLDAMSGGEKSLTALSFIFAIQRHNPAPFYALDEIDAFLDAVNAERVGEMIEELAEEAQFVVVGHRSALLERSDRAIGVTMQGDNLSAVTGMQFGDDGDEEVTADD